MVPYSSVSMHLLNLCITINQWKTRFGSHLKKLPFHFGVDPLCALLVAANNAGVWSREQQQALH